MKQYLLILGFIFNLFGLWGCTQNNQDKAKSVVPSVVDGACPFECCTYTTWKAEEKLTVYADERDTSEVAFTLDKGTEFKAVTGNVHVIKPGKVVPMESFNIELEDTIWNLAKGDTLYLLAYSGEGYYDAWLHGNKGSVSGEYWYWGNQSGAGATTKRVARLINDPVTQWWAKIIDGQGREGWLFMKHAKITGADACS